MRTDKHGAPMGPRNGGRPVPQWTRPGSPGSAYKPGSSATEASNWRGYSRIVARPLPGTRTRFRNPAFGSVPRFAIEPLSSLASQELVDPRRLTGLVVALCEVRRVPGRGGVETGSEFEVAVALVAARMVQQHQGEQTVGLPGG
jgi:hypothetical protein